MARQIIIEIADRIREIKGEFPLRVGIDGIDAAGKTYLANEIAAYLAENGQPVIRASIDGFHNPRHIRHQRGSYSPEGYYYDSFDYLHLKQYLLEPLEPTGSRDYRLKGFDFITDTETPAEDMRATNAHILIFEGVFLFRREISHYWDLKIFVDIDFETSINRALSRDLYLFGEKQEILKKYNERYIPGQKIYLGLEKPLTQADMVIDNNDYSNPVITIRNRPAQTTD